MQVRAVHLYSEQDYLLSQPHTEPGELPEEFKFKFEPEQSQDKPVQTHSVDGGIGRGGILWCYGRQM